MPKPAQLLDGVGRLFRENVDLQGGVHMKVIGQAINNARISNLKSAQDIAISIMDGATTRDTSFEREMASLSLVDGGSQRTVAAKLINYKKLPVSATMDETPNDWDLMDKNAALSALKKLGKPYSGNVLDIHAATDRILLMSSEQQSNIVALGLEDCGVNCNHLVPLGLELQ